MIPWWIYAVVFVITGAAGTGIFHLLVQWINSKPNLWG